jgi:trehalose 6-phosphate phosphatase
VTADTLTIGLRRSLAQLARTPRLLVACDYDGTLAPIVADPQRATPIPESVTALRSLAAMPATTTAVISGRALRDLAVLSRLPAEVHLVGSHGSEFDIGFVHELTPAQRELHEKLWIELGALVDGRSGVHLEVKPASIAVHLRQASADVVQEILTAVMMDRGAGRALRPLRANGRSSSPRCAATRAPRSTRYATRSGLRRPSSSATTLPTSAPSPG